MAAFTKKDWLYVTGSVASMIALGLWVYTQKTQTISAGADSLTDQMNETASSPGPMYTNYNLGSYGAPTQAGADVSPDVSNTSCCCANNDCAGSSPLANGQTFDDLQSLLNFYQTLNPNYVQAQKNALQQYYTSFASGMAYSNNGQTTATAQGIL